MSEKNESAPSYFLRNLLLFGRLLRVMGLDVGASEMIDLTHALAWIDVGKKQDVYQSARAILVWREDEKGPDA